MTDLEVKVGDRTFTVAKVTYKVRDGQNIFDLETFELTDGRVFIVGGDQLFFKRKN